MAPPVRRAGASGSDPDERADAARVPLADPLAEADGSASELARPWRRRPPRHALDWAAGVVAPGARVERARILRGGGWLATHALDVVEPSGQRHEVVLRRWARPGWQDDDPRATPEAEAATLMRLARAAPDVPVPRVLGVDRDGSPTGVPALLVTRLPGAPPTRALLRRDDVLATLCETLARIHRLVELADAVPPYGAYYRVEDLRPPVESRRPELWERAFRAAAGPAPSHEPGPSGALGTSRTFLHRDFHPGNTLWVGGRLTGVVDWTGACSGPPGADLAHLLANLGMSHGPAAAEAAAAHYRAAAGGDPPDADWWRLRGFLDYAGDFERDPPAVVDAAERYLEAILQRT